MLRLSPAAVLLLTALLPGCANPSTAIDGATPAARPAVAPAQIAVPDASDPSTPPFSVDPEMILVPDPSATVDMPTVRPQPGLDSEMVWPPRDTTGRAGGDFPLREIGESSP